MRPFTDRPSFLIILCHVHFCTSREDCFIRTDMLFHWLIELAWKQDDHRVSSLPLLIKKSLWATATSKYTWCFHPAVAVKWAGEAWIKRHEGGGARLNMPSQQPAEQLTLNIKEIRAYIIWENDLIIKESLWWQPPGAFCFIAKNSAPPCAAGMRLHFVPFLRKISTWTL